MSNLKCAACGDPIYLSATSEALRRSDRKTFYCSKGHRNCFPGKTKEEKDLEDALHDLKRVKQRLARMETRKNFLSSDLDAAESSNRALKGWNTRYKKRIKELSA